MRLWWRQRGAQRDVTSCRQSEDAHHDAPAEEGFSRMAWMAEGVDGKKGECLKSRSASMHADRRRQAPRGSSEVGSYLRLSSCFLLRLVDVQATAFRDIARARRHFPLTQEVLSSCHRRATTGPPLLRQAAFSFPLAVTQAHRNGDSTERTPSVHAGYSDSTTSTTIPLVA